MAEGMKWRMQVGGAGVARQRASAEGMAGEPRAQREVVRGRKARCSGSARNSGAKRAEPERAEYGWRHGENAERTAMQTKGGNGVAVYGEWRYNGMSNQLSGGRGGRYRESGERRYEPCRSLLVCQRARTVLSRRARV